MVYLLRSLCVVVGDQMYALNLLVICCLLRVGVCLNSHEWDHIVFTQHWPASVCTQWKSKGAAHTCALPAKNIWTIHGLWPSRRGSEGPSFCNSSLHFDAHALDPIFDNLTENWINVDMPTPKYSFWEYEWKKHGTCATTLPQLDTEFKYFSQGLQWLDKYDMAPILSSCGFTEGNSYSAKKLWAGVKNHFGKIPTLHCFKDKDTGLSYLFEIRICFDKDLQLIDCPENAGSEYIANCPETDVQYPSFRTIRRLEIPKKKWLLDALNLLGWIQWFTH